MREDNYVLRWSGETWTLALLKRWQQQHKFWQMAWTDGAQSRGGAANSERQQQQRANNRRLLELATRLTEIKAYKMAEDGRDQAQIARALGKSESSVPRIIARAKERVPKLTDAERQEAIEYGHGLKDQKGRELARTQHNPIQSQHGLR